MREIRLRILNGCWMARHVGDERAEIVRLFGTDEIPTAFTEAAPALRVLTAIARLNPGCRVVLTESEQRAQEVRS